MAASFSPRPSQRRILEYAGGTLGISAVPGSGKTHTLSALAAQIISSGQLLPEQEVLIVTLVNSAVDNFSARIREFVKARGLIPQLSYRVRTLHGLAHDIVREDPPLVGLDKKFSIVDENASSVMIREAARAWVATHPDVMDEYLSPSLGEHERRSTARKDWPELVEDLAADFIRSAKDHQLAPEELRLRLEHQPSRLGLAEMGLQIYADYQRALTYRGAVDFDDLIRLAYRLLQASPDLLERLRYRWPFVLEDEAQDSSKIQQAILSMLVGEHGNWVRVGDPNQAIFETFTTADPELLREFIRHNPHVDMPETGRCQPSIMRLANHLIDWVMAEHPEADARSALSPPYMLPTPAGDAQLNPPDDPAGIVFVNLGSTPDEEVEAVAKSISEWLPAHQDQTVAVLSSTNDHAARAAEALKRRDIQYRELLRSTSPTRATAGALSYVLAYLAAPDSASKLAHAYRVWRRDWRDDEQQLPLYDRVARIIGKLKNLEDYLAPTVALPHGAFKVDASSHAEPVLTAGGPSAADIAGEMAAFRDVIRRWHAAAVLPIDQLILTLSQEIFKLPADLALAHKLALVMRQIADENPQWRLPELTPNLQEIARNERRFIGFSSDDAGFNPDDYKGIVVVSTMHKAKGLEWDRVYLMSVNNYDYPSNAAGDRFISEKWFLRDRLNLAAEALAQLKTCVSSGEYDYYQEGSPTRRARLDYVRERLRLFYVGITRARRNLIISWNTGRRGDAVPSPAYSALQVWHEQRRP